MSEWESSFEMQVEAMNSPQDLYRFFINILDKYGLQLKNQVELYKKAEEEDRSGDGTAIKYQIEMQSGQFQNTIRMIEKKFYKLIPTPEILIEKIQGLDKEEANNIIRWWCLMKK